MCSAITGQVVVVFQENHSFDNLYGHWGTVGGTRVSGLRAADTAHQVQVGQDGKPYACLLQNDVNLTSPPQLDMLPRKRIFSHNITLFPN